MKGFVARYRSKQGERGPWELREGIRSRARELRALLLDRISRHEADSRIKNLVQEALDELGKAEDALNHRAHSRYKQASHLAVGQIHVDTAHNLLLRLSGPSEVIPMMPGLLAIVQAHLASSDPRRVGVERIDHWVRQKGTLTEEDLELILDAVGVARQASIRETLRVRSFVNIVGWVTGFLAAGAVLLAVLAGVSDDTLPLCFTPGNGVGNAGYSVVCPIKTDVKPQFSNPDKNVAATTTPLDYTLVEIVGLVSAAIAAATTLRRIRGTATPYNVPVVLAVLKLPTGALTAVLGLLLMRGGFVPGLSALDSSAQIIAWAIVFGYAQQLFTRLVDSQAQSVLNAVGGANQTGPSAPPATLSSRAAGQ
ncbi:hypothetical protein ACFCVY_15050 [Streptomyces sp. NPDC056411]|uniref:hypothetical protein n=1 Tax=Streptomyces sp. NPDC056411 TaxID=3345813 RepID=UPI0035E16107